MKAILPHILSAAIFAACASRAQAGEKAPLHERQLIGDYRYETKSDSVYAVYIDFSVWREGDKIVIGFEGAHPHAAGAAPEGGGTGQIDSEGVLRFEYEDSFSNKGTGTFQRVKNGYKLFIQIDGLVEERCAMYYGGDFILKRVSSVPRHG